MGSSSAWQVPTYATSLVSATLRPCRQGSGGRNDYDIAPLAPLQYPRPSFVYTHR